MQSKIPVPTDNIYKFYALFGVLIFISSIWAMKHLNDSLNQQAIAVVSEITSITEKGVLSTQQIAHRDSIIDLVNEKAKDTRALTWGLSIICIGSFVIIGYGFRRWHTKVQPLLDKEAEIRLDTAKLELKKLQSEVEGLSDPALSTPPEGVESPPQAAQPTPPPANLAPETPPASH